MAHWRLLSIVALLALLLFACSPGGQSQAAAAPAPPPPAVVQSAAPCPVTLPPDPAFTPPPPNAPSLAEGYFWYGSAALWTELPKNGVWSALPHNPEGYTQKVLWWRQGYSWTAEPQPQLVVSGRRLDAAAPPLNISRATNAFAPDIQSAMLVGVDFPTLGCWEITGRYAGTTLSFVVRVAP